MDLWLGLYKGLVGKICEIGEENERNLKEAKANYTELYNKFKANHFEDTREVSQLDVTDARGLVSAYGERREIFNEILTFLQQQRDSVGEEFLKEMKTIS